MVISSCYYLTCQENGDFIFNQQNSCHSLCLYGDWSDWSRCPSCSDSSSVNQVRSRKLQADYTIDQHCSPIDIQKQPCSNVSCFCINGYNCSCILSPWGGWSSCSRECGLGSRYRERFFITEGLLCNDSSLLQTQDCNEQCCAGILYLIIFFNILEFI